MGRAPPDDPKPGGQTTKYTKYTKRTKHFDKMAELRTSRYRRKVSAVARLRSAVGPIDPAFGRNARLPALAGGVFKTDNGEPILSGLSGCRCALI